VRIRGDRPIRGDDSWRQSEIEPERELDLTVRPQPDGSPTVLVSCPKVAAAAAVYGCPGCTLLSSLKLLVGSAFGSVAAGFAKLSMLNTLKTFARSSMFCFARSGR
jgi:hypothetical protein